MVDDDPRLLRSRDQVLSVLVHHGSVSRTELAATTGLAPGTVARALRGLLASGAVREVAPDPAAPVRRGRPLARFVVAEAEGAVVGIDLGLSRIVAGLASASGTIVRERAVTVDERATAAQLCAAAAAVVGDLLETCGLSRADVLRAVATVPAPVDPVTGRVEDAPVVVDAWRGTHPAALLEQVLGLPLIVVNDANAAALAEHRSGAGRGCGNLVYLHATSGVGAGLVLDGEVRTGTAGGAGEIGHIRLHGASELCRCGQRGCLESEASTAALARKMAAVGVTVAGGRFEDTVRAHLGDPVVARLLTQAGAALGSVLAEMCNVLSPEVVVIGGELAAGGEAVTAGVRESMRRYALSSVSRRVRIELCGLGARAAMLGAVAAAVSEAARPSSRHVAAVPAARASL